MSELQNLGCKEVQFVWIQTVLEWQNELYYDLHIRARDIWAENNKLSKDFPVCLLWVPGVFSDDLRPGSLKIKSLESVSCRCND